MIGRITPELLRVFIRRIDVWEKEVKYSRTCGNRIDICFTFLPEESTTIKGECIELLPANASKTQNPEGWPSGLHKIFNFPLRVARISDGGFLF